MMIKQFVGFAGVCVVGASQAWAGVSGVYDANNVLVGEYAESTTIIHSVRGFRFSLDTATGTVRALNNPTGAITDIGGVNYETVGGLGYPTTDCTGQAYVTVDSVGPHAGGVMISAGNKGLYYVTKTPTAFSLALASFFDGSSCTATVPGVDVIVPVLPNDPTVTGVPNTPFALPIHLEMVPLSQFFQIFKNGFESSFQVERYFRRWQSGQTHAVVIVAETRGIEGTT